MGTIAVDGAELHVEEIGSGPPVLVLHGGLGVDHSMYRGFDALADSFRVVYVDHRGNGRSTGDLGTATMQQWASDTAIVAERTGGGDPVIVIGHSYGGFIAQEMMISHPGVLAGAVLVATTPGQLGTGEEPAPEGPPMAEELAAIMGEPPSTDEGYAELLSRAAPAYVHRIDPDVLRALMPGTVFRLDAMLRGNEVLAHWSSVDRLAQVSVPALVVAGRHDPICAWPQAHRIADRLADAEVVVFEDSAHVPWIEEPDAFFPVVRDWLERRGLVRRA